MSTLLIVCSVRSETLIRPVQARSYGCIPYKENSSLQGEVHTKESGTGSWRVCGTLIRRPYIALIFYHDDAFLSLTWIYFAGVFTNLCCLGFCFATITFYPNMCIFGSGYGYGVFHPLLLVNYFFWSTGTGLIGSETIRYVQITKTICRSDAFRY